MNEQVKSAQDILFEQMIVDYHTGKYEELNLFKPYIDWKQCGGSPTFTKAQSWEMRDKATSILESYYDKYPESSVIESNSFSENHIDPWIPYSGFKDDRYIVSYLEIIESELCYIHEILE